MRALFVFLGKGGVGKTTSSFALSLWLAKRGFKTFLFSVDPAHNLSDVAGTDLSEKREVVANLDALEVDVASWVDAFLSETVSRMKRLYKQLSIVGLEGMIDSMRLSPGMEEVAILYAVYELLRDAESAYDYVVMDTPPTGLTLRMLALPGINTEWVNILRMWRLKILDRRRMVAGIKGKDYLGDVPLEEDDDRVLDELSRHLSTMRWLMGLFSDRNRCQKLLVVNQDALSVQEGVRITETLKKLGMDVRCVLLNKFGLLPLAAEEVKGKFHPVPVYELPFIEGKSKLTFEDLLFIARGWAEEVLS